MWCNHWYRAAHQLAIARAYVKQGTVRHELLGREGWESVTRPLGRLLAPAVLPDRKLGISHPSPW